MELRENGWAAPITRFAKNGGAVIGICGGYQMLGQKVLDPHGLEGDIRSIDGLGLLQIETELMPEKTVKTSFPKSNEFDCDLQGYEIHMGHTQGADCARPMVEFDTHCDGAISETGNVRGCYLHGLFGSDVYRRKLLKQLGLKHAAMHSHAQNVEDALDEFAADLEKFVDVDGLLELAR